MRKEKLWINGESFKGINHDFDSFFCFFDQGKSLKLLKIQGTGSVLDVLYQMMHHRETPEIQILVQTEEKEEKWIPLQPSLMTPVFSIAFYAWYMKYGKNQMVHTETEVLQNELVQNRIMISEQRSFYIHKICSDKNSLDIVKDLADHQFPEVYGVLINHQFGKAKFTSLGHRDYAYKTVGALLLEHSHITPSFVFSLEELKEYTLEELQEISKHTSYNPDYKFSHISQPTLKQKEHS